MEPCILGLGFGRCYQLHLRPGCEAYNIFFSNLALQEVLSPLAFLDNNGNIYFGV